MRFLMNGDKFVLVNNKFIVLDGNGSTIPVIPDEPIIPDEPNIIFNRNPNNYTEMQEITSIITNYKTANKISIILRHSERFKSNEDGDNDSINGDLTANGKTYAERLGTTLKSLNLFNKNNLQFFGTTTFRTEETCKHIGKALFDESIDNINVTKNDSVLKPNYTTSDSWPTVAAYPTSSERTSWESLSKQTCKSILDLTNKYSICISHDLNLIPLIKWTSNEKITFNFKGNSGDPWLCYLAGLVLVENNSEITTIPVYSITQYADGTNIASGESGYHGVMKSIEDSGYGNILHK